MLPQPQWPDLTVPDNLFIVEPDILIRVWEGGIPKSTPSGR